MLSVPSNWNTQLAAPSQTYTAHVNVLRNGVFLIDYPVEAVKVTVDRTANQRRVGQITITQDPSLLSALAQWQSPIAPAGNELRPWYVMNFPDGSSAEVPLCTAPIITTTVTDSGADLTVVMDVSDRSWLFSESKLLTPYIVSPGTTVSAAIMQIANQAWTGRGSLAMSITPTNEVIPSTGYTIKAGKDYWSSITELAATCGYEVFFDVWGTLVAQPIVDPSNNAPVWGVGGIFNGAVLASLKSTRNKVYSQIGITATGTTQVTSAKTGKLLNKKTAFTVIASVTDPSSPININGGFGVVSNLNRDATMTSTTQAQAAAQTILNLEQGNFGALSIGSLPNFALDVDDVVSVNVPRLGVSGNYIIDGWVGSISAAATTMDLTIRAVGTSG